MSIFHQLKKKLAGLMTVQPTFDPSSLNDPVALKTKWTPAKAGGASFGTHRLKKISPNRAEFQPRALAVLFPAVFMIAGLASAIGMSIAGLNGDINMLYFGLPFGGIFFLVGFFIWRSWLAPRVFDRRLNLYWRGRQTPTLGRPNKTPSWPLNSIYAVQLISEYCTSSSSSGGSSSYYSYELNLVFKNARRVNVVDHGKHTHIIEDAHSLTDFLAVPLWDAT